MPHGNTGYSLVTKNRVRSVTVTNNSNSVDSTNNAANAQEANLHKASNQSILDLQN